MTKKPFELRDVHAVLELAGASEMAQVVKEGDRRLHELEALFDLQWKADQRGIKRWQAAAPEGEDRSMTWPDRADMVVFLLDELERSEQTAGEAYQLVGQLSNGRAEALLQQLLDGARRGKDTVEKALDLLAFGTRVEPVLTSREKIVQGLKEAVRHARGEEVGARVTIVTVEESKGCVHCDIGLMPLTLHHGRRVHRLRENLVDCTAPPEDQS